MVVVSFSGREKPANCLVFWSLRWSALLHIYNCVPDCKPTAASLLASNEEERITKKVNYQDKRLKQKLPLLAWPPVLYSDYYE